MLLRVALLAFHCIHLDVTIDGYDTLAILNLSAEHSTTEHATVD